MSRFPSVADVFPSVLLPRDKEAVARFRSPWPRFATSAAEGVEFLHRFHEPILRSVQVGGGLREARVPGQFMNVVQGHPAFEPSAAGFVSQVVKAQVDDA